MDNITAQNCKDGKGGAEYARVLVEFDVDKGFKEEICIQYRSKDNVIRGAKKVQVEYVWKPHICSQCKVFGHRDEKCSKFKRMGDESIDVGEDGGFTQVRYRKNFGAKRNDRNGMNQWGGNKRNVWNNNGIYKKKDKEMGSNGEKQMQGKTDSTSKLDGTDKTERVSQNMFAPLDDMSEKHKLDVLKDRMIEEDGMKEADENNEKNKDVFIRENIETQRCSANDVNGEEIFGKERRVLWDEINAAKIIVDENPWCLLGDFNVTIKAEEHSSGGSTINEDMQEPDSSIMKKLDRIMVNQSFMTKFGNAMGHFRPFMTSDHCPDVLSIARCLRKKKKSFRFPNFIVDKGEFIPIVKEGWEK
ncbi:RNA-directed DNA polymerase, eukaryota, reverse transcriptase zinc-binding domain protein [Tanacetum coccineum]